MTALSFEGRGSTIEEALKKAHAKIPQTAGKDFAISKVIDWGMQFGGFAQATLFYVVVEEDKSAAFKTDQ